MANPAGNPQTLIPGGKPKREKIYFDYQDIANDRLKKQFAAKCPFELDKQGRHVQKVKLVVEHLIDRLIAMALQPHLAAAKLVIQISNGEVPGSMKALANQLLEKGHDVSYSQAVRIADERMVDILARIEAENDKELVQD